MTSSRKHMWDTLDRLEGRKDSSYEALQRERVRQGYARQITRKQWEDKPDDYKMVKDGQRYMLILDSDGVTRLAPVIVNGMRAPPRRKR